MRALKEVLDVVPIADIDPEDYYDFQFSRPAVHFDELGNRELTWPGTEFLRASKQSSEQNPRFGEIFALLGVEPARRWKSFTVEVLEMIEDSEIDSVVFLGAMLADVPHTRPIPVMATSQNAMLRQELGIERSNYEGPVGILSVLGIALEAAGIPSMALWASVPHYVQSAPSPKAALALLIELEKYLGIQFDHASMAEDAFAWERGIDDLAEGDEEMASYITQLERSRDELESERANGDALAQELERFLQGKADDEPRP